MSPYTLTKLSIITGVLALLLLGETLIPQFTGRSHRLRHGATNLALGVVNAGALALILAALIVTSAEWAESRGFGLLNQITLPAWAEWAMALVLFDMWMYLWHRANHRLPILWRFHAVHHTDEELDATSALRFHLGEIILSTLARAAIIPLLGMSLTQLLVYEIILQPVILFHHSNIRIPARLDAVLRLLIVTPRMHWVHHSDYQPETDSNYSSVLSVWDRLFRSLRLRKDPSTLRLGLRGFTPRESRGLPGILATPFTHRFRRSAPDDESAPPADNA